jgi:hypothetical protein
MSEFYIRNNAKTIFKKYNIAFSDHENFLEISNQDLSTLPNKEILKIIGLKNDEGHDLLVASLNKIVPEWLQIFFISNHFYDVYDINGEVVMVNMHEFLLEIIEGKIKKSHLGY